jgi:hypothetical protein
MTATIMTEPWLTVIQQILRAVLEACLAVARA